MACKTLNKRNLANLGADRLTELLLQTVEGDTARQRRVRMALAEGQGSQEAAADIRKRFASIRRARSFLSSHGQKTLVRELADLTDMIENRAARGNGLRSPLDHATICPDHPRADRRQPRSRRRYHARCDGREQAALPVDECVRGVLLTAIWGLAKSDERSHNDPPHGRGPETCTFGPKPGCQALLQAPN